MSNDDTFFGSGGSGDRTILKPRPGGRSAGTPRQEPPQRPAQTPPPAPMNSLAGASQAGSPLTAAATPLLSLAGRLAGTAHHPDPQQLSQQISQAIRQFEMDATTAGVPQETVLVARYVLCSLLDEMALNTPWGSQSSWAAQTLLSTFHKEAWGGEKFFEIHDRVLQDPGRNLDLIELLFMCLCMGFEGKYRHSGDGVSRLAGIRDNLAAVLRTQRGEHERALSPRWQGVERTDSPLTRHVPMWVFASVAIGIAVLAYLGFVFNANRASDAVTAEIAALGRDVPPIVEQRGFIEERTLKLSDLLQGEVAAGRIEVTEKQGTETVTLRALFDSGSADIRGAQREILETVAGALDQLPGPVLITGHTDNVPSRSLRYPSNWHLSKERAESVQAFLAARIAAERIVAEPRADSDPLVPNDSASNRAMNRRVEITLFSEMERGQ